MKLRELDGRFLKIIGPRTFREGVPFAEAQGVMFLCLLCFATTAVR
jgi:hypothetical protein